MDPGDRLVKARAGAALARKKIGMRYVMCVVPLDPSGCAGRTGGCPPTRATRPCSCARTATVARDRIAGVDVRDVLLELGGVGAPVAS